MPKTFFNWAKQFFVTSFSFDSRDELLFPTLVEYMHEKDVLRRINNFTVRMVRQGPEYQSLQDELQQGGKPQAYLSPGEGFHLFFLDGKLMWMRRECRSAAQWCSKKFD